MADKTVRVWDTNTQTGVDTLQKDLGSSQHAPAVVPQATENHLGEIGYSRAIIAVTPTLDNAVAYGAGDVLFDTTAIAGALRVNDGTGVLMSVFLNDKDDQAAAGLDLYFFSANVSLGTRNSTPNISDANADNLLGIVSVATGDWKDLGGCKVASIKNIWLPIKAGSGVTTIWVAGVTAGTPTTTTSGLVMRFGITRD